MELNNIYRTIQEDLVKVRETLISISHVDFPWLAEQLGYARDKIIPFNPDEQTQNRAPRHKNGVISVAKAQRILGTRMLSIEDTILRSIASNR